MQNFLYLTKGSNFYECSLQKLIAYTLRKYPMVQDITYMYKLFLLCYFPYNAIFIYLFTRVTIQTYVFQPADLVQNYTVALDINFLPPIRRFKHTFSFNHIVISNLQRLTAWKRTVKENFQTIKVFVMDDFLINFAASLVRSQKHLKGMPKQIREGEKNDGNLFKKASGKILLLYSTLL